MYFLSDVALFARKKQEEPRRRTLRDNIIGTTNAGKAFRVGALASAAGLIGLGLKKKSLGDMVKNPKNFFTRDVNDLPQTVKTTMSHSKVKNKGDRITEKGRHITDPDKVATRKPGTFLDDEWQKNTDLYDTTVRETYSKDKEKGFLGTDRKVRWSRVGKAAGLAGGALAVPTGLAYIAGGKKEKEDIEKRLSQGSKTASKGLESTRRLINTLHRVSR